MKISLMLLVFTVIDSPMKILMAVFFQASYFIVLFASARMNA